MGRALVAGLGADCGLLYQPLYPRTHQKEGKVILILMMMMMMMMTLMLIMTTMTVR